MKEMTLVWSRLAAGRERYNLETVVRSAGGVFGEQWRARDLQANGKLVIVKILPYTDTTDDQHIHDEYAILRDFTTHPNIQQFYGVFCERSSEGNTAWFVLEFCELGTVLDLVRKMVVLERKMSEEHLGFILKEVLKAACYLHDNKVIHRNIRGSSVFLTREGEVKLGELGLSGQLTGSMGKRHTCIGSPGWMAPEVACGGTDGYDNRADVWALGITAIELADGRAPYQGMHPTRALFHIVRNPPPSLDRPSNWSNDINDFITECLEKNPEHRPFMIELMEHPFIQAVPENDFHLTQELKKLTSDLEAVHCLVDSGPENIIKNSQLITNGASANESMLVEDIAALEILTEDSILEELHKKMLKGSFTSYIGDILLILGPFLNDELYNDLHHSRYECKSRADNEPHVFGAADAAYQSALHHREPQHIVFSGESGSGKTTHARHALAHLLYLGRPNNNTAGRVQQAADVIRAAITAATPSNAASTRAILQTRVTYGSTGKLSGAIFFLFQLEKWRVSSTDMSHANFDLLYYFYDSMETEGNLGIYSLESGRKYRYLRVPDGVPSGTKILLGARHSTAENVKKYKIFKRNLLDLDCEQNDINALESILAAILVLGNVRFKDKQEGFAEIENPEEANKVAQLLLVDDAKFRWSLLNYCIVKSGTAVKRTHTSDEARDARDTLAAALYKRLVDWIVNSVNGKLTFGRSVFGDKYSVSLMDMFGFECFHRNRLEQLIVNTTNEQMQFLYNQRTFVWEMQEQQEEQVPVVNLGFYDNKSAVDQLMGRPMGLFYILDEASRTSCSLECIMSSIKNTNKAPFMKLSGSHEFSVAHFAGKIKYDAREMGVRNRDFLPPEMIETMRASSSSILQTIFRSKLSRSGNLVCSASNAVVKGQYSQLRRMRTAAATYRGASLELLKQLSVGAGSGGIQFVRCVRAHLGVPAHSHTNTSEHFHFELVRQQLRALAVLDTAKARQRGYSSRIPFAEFLRRYKFLAFDYDENVEENSENCRLLLIRLKMEGWLLGKTRVFLKYYNEEFLSRLYERQVKKIVKVQCMMRAFMARRKAIKNKSKIQHIKDLKKQHSTNASEDEAALLIQKAYRGYVVRKAYGPLVSKTSGHIDEETASFLKRFALKWKSRSIFQVLLQYRARRYQDLVHFSQQVHIYNQSAVEGAGGAQGAVPLERVDPHTRAHDFLGAPARVVWKLPFRIDQLGYHDTTHMCSDMGQYDSDEETWDEPLKRRHSTTATQFAVAATQTLIHIPFCRDSTEAIQKLIPVDESPKKQNRSETELTSKPTVYKKKQVSSARTHYQPPTPWTAESRPLRHVRTSHKPDDLNNPIRELQALAKASDISEDAPFNFQAMLKKTPRNRASMKRSGESDVILEDRRGSGKLTSRCKLPAPRAPVTPPANVVPRHKTPCVTNASLVTLRHHPTNDVRFITNSDIQIEKVQLAPGITVKGEITDL